MKETTHNEGQRLSIRMKGSLLLVRELEVNNLLILDVTNISRIYAEAHSVHRSQYRIMFYYHAPNEGVQSHDTYSKRECDNAIAAIQQSIFNDYDFM